MQRLFELTLRSRGLPWFIRYALSILLVLVTLAVRLYFDEPLRPVPFLLFFVPILFSALVFDRGSGFVAIAASALCIAYFFLEPVGSLRVARGAPLNALLLFIAITTVLAFVIEALHLAYKNLARRTEELARSEATLGAVLDALPVGVIIADASGRILRDNAANRELWGVPPDTPNWEAYGDWVGYRPDTGERIRADEWAMARALLKGEVVRDELVENERFGTGERRLYINNAAPVRDAGGAIVAGVVAELDVTDRLAAERALRESERRFRAFVEGAPHKMWVTRPDGTVEFFNQTWRDYTGLPADADPAAWAGVVHPDDRERFRAERARGLASGRPYAVEIRLRTRDGSHRWHVSSVVPVLAEEGGVFTWVGTSVDVDDAHRAQAAIRAERDRAELYFDTAGVMLLVIGADRKVSRINRAGAEILGRSREDIVGRDWIETFVPERERERVGQVFARFAAGEAEAPGAVENLVLRGDGAERLIQWRNTTLRDEAGRFLATISSGADVTELRAAEAELRASEERNRLIVETARDYAILTTDLEGRITSWSPGAEAVFGHAPEDVLGRDVALLFTPEDREAREPARERDAARRQGSAADNRCYVRRDGERFWLEGAAWPLHDPAGRETGILKVGRDDTARRKTDLLMRDAVDRQAFLTREVGHRIKNNLAIVASLLSLQARNAGSEETRTALDDARGRIDAIAQVHDQLWRQNQSETIDLDDFLRDLCARVQQAVPHHRIDYAGADGPVTIAIERAVTLSLVVNELVTNAAKYAYPSGEGGPIVVSLGRPEPEVLRLEVADRGIGFAEGAAHGGSGDAGFGTRMLRTLTRQLGATLEVTGDEGGTRVTLIIPPMAA